MPELMISADDHIDIGYLPKDLWTERLPRSLSERVPHVEERGSQDLWVCDGHIWTEWRAGRWFADPKRRKIALDRAFTAENFTRRPTTARAASEATIATTREGGRVRSYQAKPAARATTSTTIAAACQVTARAPAPAARRPPRR